MFEAETLDVNLVTNLWIDYRELARVSSTSAGSYPCHIIPYPRNSRFQGRQQMLSEMGKILLPCAQGLPRSLALTGIGGVGKSQTALEFVYCNKTAFDAILWASADTIVKVNQAYASFGSALGLQSASRGGDCVREDIKKWMCNTGKLEARHLPFLYILTTLRLYMATDIRQHR